MFRDRLCYIVKDNILLLLTGNGEVPIWAKHSLARLNRQTNKNNETQQGNITDISFISDK